MTSENFFLSVSRLNRLYAKSLTMRLSPYDAQPGYLSILHQLWNKDVVTQKELNGYLEIEQATISNTLKRMERDGLIERAPDKNDKRKQLIRLTSKGQSLKAHVDNAVSNLQTVVNQGLTINDRRYFMRILKQMTERLEEDQTDSLFVLLDEIKE